MTARGCGCRPQGCWYFPQNAVSTRSPLEALFLTQSGARHSRLKSPGRRSPGLCEVPATEAGEGLCWASPPQQCGL